MEFKAFSKNVLENQHQFESSTIKILERKIYNKLHMSLVKFKACVKQIKQYKATNLLRKLCLI